MKITQETDYAFRILLFLGNLGVGKKVDAKTRGKVGINELLRDI